MSVKSLSSNFRKPWLNGVVGTLFCDNKIESNIESVTQITSGTTSVSINSPVGIITTVSLALTPYQSNVFTVNNSIVNENSSIFVAINNYSGNYGTQGSPICSVQSVSNGSFDILMYNVNSSTNLAGTLSIAFFVQNEI